MISNERTALHMRGITKHFPGVVANHDIDFSVQSGEVHGLLGENGAGKTTLMNILYGLHHQDEGEIYLDGQEVKINNPHEAVELGIGMVHQHFMLVENLTAVENAVLGMPVQRPPLLELTPARDRFIGLAEEYDLEVQPDTPVWQLPVGDQQWLEILKQLFRDAKLLILDEPTSVLAPAQIEHLFKTIRRLADEGRAVVFISHKLDEIQEVTDRVTVLRDGEVVGTIDTEEATPTLLAEMMVGRQVSLGRRSRPEIKEGPEPVLQMHGVGALNDRGVPALKDFDLVVHAGEILGVAGVDGNGQRELAQCIVGLREVTDGRITIKGTEVKTVISDPPLLGYIPEDRRKTGLVLDFTVAENLVIRTFDEPPYSRNSILRYPKIRSRARELIKEFSIKTPNELALARTLSGGNQQKLVLARELNANPALLIASQPTRGLDLGAVEFVHETIIQERNRGAAVLFISTELSEVLALSDRIIVLYKGEIMGEVSGDDAHVRVIGEWMLGHRVPAESREGRSA